MKKFVIILSLLFNVFLRHIVASNVSIDNGKFKIGNEDFYPVCMNYETEAFFDGTNYFVAPSASYGINTSSDRYECYDPTACFAQLKADFDYISGMGFNCIRIGASPRYTIGSGLNMKVTPWSNLHYLLVNPSISNDPGMNLLLNYYDKILELAASAQPHSLKVIFIVINHIYEADDTTLHKSQDPNIVYDMNVYLDILSQHLSSSPHADAFFAYDLYNEPCWFIKQIPKNEACEIISTRYDLIKSNDPDHLITIGSCGIMDILSFDPSILKLDFITYHFYPDFNRYENKSFSIVQQRAQQRFSNKLFWVNRISRLPWMIAETGFAAGITMEPGMHGNLQQMGDYTNYSLNAVCNCGGKGYGWWKYQESNWAPVTSIENYLGLLIFNNAPGPAAEKQPAVDYFRNYIPHVNGSCLSDYSPLYSDTRNYYNPNSYPPSPNNELSATVKDQNGNPISDVFVVARYIATGTLGNHSEDFYTFTDETGYFKIFPYFDASFLNIGAITSIQLEYIVISGPATERVKFYPTNFTNNITINRFISHVDYQNQTITGNISMPIVSAGSITASNVSVMPGNELILQAPKWIKLNPDFSCARNTHGTFIITPVPMDCNEFNNYRMERHSFISEKSFSTDKKYINLQLPVSLDGIHISPNPTSGNFNISGSSSQELFNINLIDMFGKKIEVEKNISLPFTFDLSKYSGGIYVIEIYNDKFMEQYNIVKQ